MATIVLTTFLSMVQQLAKECGTTKDPATSITTIVGATGEVGRLASWIQDAWRDIQSLHPDWQFLRQTATWTTVNGQATYTPAQCGLAVNTFGAWARDTFRNYKTSVGQNSEIFMSYMPYDVWRDTYQYGALRTSYSQPFVMTICPDMSIGLGPVPLVGYTVQGDYYTGAVDLQADADVPSLPSWHNKMVIVARAMMSYGAFESAPEVYARGEAQYRSLMTRLENDQLPPVSGGICLA